MFPLVPTLVLALVSFVSSVFVVLRILLPILPPHPFSRRVRPSEFGLPNYRSLSAADKSHVWLALCDVIALILIVVEAVMQYNGSASGFASTSDVGSSIRLWIAFTLRQTCLVVVSVLTLVHVRLGQPVNFGSRYWMLWAPLAVLAIASTGIAAVVAGAGVHTFFWGALGYTAVLALGSTASFAYLVRTLVVIKRNLATIEDDSSWPPVREVEEKPRPSFATEDVDRLRDGSSWITSAAGSDRDSISAFSFSTHNTHVQHPAIASNPSIPAKNSFWFNPATPGDGAALKSVPPVPPLPSPYRARLGDEHPDPFRRGESPVAQANAHVQRLRNGSQTSWLTSTDGSRPTPTTWSFPSSRPGSPNPELDAAVASTQDLNSGLLGSSSRPNTPALASAQVLGGYGYVPSASPDTEKGITVLAAESSHGINVSFLRIATWLAVIWAPFGLAVPYFITLNAGHPDASMVSSILLIVSITLSGPLLMMSLLLKHGLPVPTGLFDSRKPSVSTLYGRSTSPTETLRVPARSAEYKRSASMTVVDGRRSTDVWLASGEAVEGKSKVGRALTMLAPAPKLSVLPPADNDDVPPPTPITPPLPMQDAPSTASLTSTTISSIEFGRSRARTKSTTSSARLSEDESVAFQARIMTAQRHYSQLAMAVVMPPSPEPERTDSNPTTPTEGAMATGVDMMTPPNRGAHLRTRSASSWSSPQFPTSPAPNSPLPPTPPNRFAHRKTHSTASVGASAGDSSGYDFGYVTRGDANEIDALSAKVLPILVPGLTVGANTRVTPGDAIPSPHSLLPPIRRSSQASKRSSKSRYSQASAAPEFGGYAIEEISEPRFHSTPHQRNGPVPKRSAAERKKHHFSLPSLALGKDGAHALATWAASTKGAIDDALHTDDKRKTVAVAPMTAVIPASPALSTASSRAPSTSPPAVALPAVPDAGDRNSLALLLEALAPVPAIPVSASGSTLALNANAPPQSATSEVTLFDLEDIAPLAESTPPDYRRRSAGRSSITYVRSDDATGVPASRRTWGVRPLKIKADRDRAPAAGGVELESQYAALPSAEPARAGLRPLSLRPANALSPARGFALGQKNGSSKGKKPLVAGPVDKENGTGVSEDGTLSKKGSKGLRGLKLGLGSMNRSDTTRERAALRLHESPPEVLVRPPSGVNGFR